MIEKQNSRIEDLEQYGRRNGIRISGIPEGDTNGHSVGWLKDFAKDHLKLNIHESTVSRMHRVGKPPPPDAPKARPREILVKFISYQYRKNFLSKNKFLRSDDNPAKL